MDDIKFAYISYDLMFDIADLLMVEPIKKPVVQIDPGYDYPTVGYFKCWLEDLDLGFGNMENFGCVFNEDTIFESRPVLVFLIAVEGQVFCVEEVRKFLTTKEFVPIFWNASKTKCNIPYNFLFISELDEIHEPVSFSRHIYFNEKKQKETILNINKPIGFLN